MATRMDEATQRARRWLQANSFHCTCEDCANAIVRRDRQTEARVRREDRKVIEAMLVSSAWAGEPALVDALKELDKLTTPPPHDDRTEPVMARQEQRFEED